MKIINALQIFFPDLKETYIFKLEISPLKKFGNLVHLFLQNIKMQLIIDILNVLNLIILYQKCQKLSKTKMI